MWRARNKPLKPHVLIFTLKHEVLMYLRKHYLKELNEFFGDIQNKAKSQLPYVRGRRRIGKSTLLQKVSQDKAKYVFYFSGIQDESSIVQIRRFVKEWSSFSSSDALMQIRPDYLDWTRILNEIDSYIKSQKHTIGLIFDEIQWIAKSKTGFVGSLKLAWVKLEENRKTRILICGSSNKFFHNHTGGEEQTLRGLKTRSNIVIHPLGAQEIAQFYGLNVSDQELILIQMLFGGIPYYLNQINFKAPLLKALNDSLFTHETIFLDEVDEILRLEFNNAGTLTAKKILSTIGCRGQSLQNIATNARMPYATVDAVINKLVEYNLLEVRTDYFSCPKENRRGVIFLINDLYLNLYFSVLLPNRRKILKNLNNEFILNSVISKNGYYIPNFSEEAFESFIIQTLRGHFHNEKEPGIIKKLHLEGQNFEVTSTWKPDLQIDVVVTDTDDRYLRAIECKWTDDSKLESVRR